MKYTPPIMTPPDYFCLKKDLGVDMKFNRTKLNAIASGVALAVATMAASAADQPTLTTAGAQSSAVFTGGATVNGGASFIPAVPAADAFDLVATIKPAAADVGKSGSLIVVVDVPGVGQFNMAPGPTFVPLDLNNVQPLVTKTLAAEEEVEILAGIIGEALNITGVTLNAFVGYYTGGDLATLSYSATPAAVTISAPPAAGCPTNTVSGSGTFAGKPVCVLSGASPITTDTHLTANNSYLIDGTVFIGENVTTANADKISLTIDAGTNLFAPEGVNTLVIDKSAQIFANGTPTNPIIMTSEQDDGSIDALGTRGKWGGLVINGVATLNTQSGTDEGEGSTGEYGGGSNPNDADNSGAVTYVQIKYAGWPITQENELNSIALQGVGSGTILDYIQVHNGGDDAIEFYGGTVNAKHLVLTGVDDDALDWTSGYLGKLQHILIEQTASGDNCIEADNLGSNPIATPRSNPVISNLTCIGSTGVKSSGHAFELKAGTAMTLRNAVIGGVFPAGGEGCIRINGDSTFSQSGASAAALNGTLSMQSSLITDACAADLQGSGTFTATEWFNAQSGSSAGTVDLGGTNGWVNGSNINSIAPAALTDSFFDAVDYIGAIKDSASDWTTGWTFTDF
jgi:hypothetical protein